MANDPVMTFEEMQKMLGLNKTKKSSVAKKADSKKKDPTPPKITSTGKPEAPIAACFMDIHFWLRDGDLFGTLLNDARDERKYRGPGVVVFAHNHLRGEDCVSECREVRVKDDS